MYALLISSWIDHFSFVSLIPNICRVSRSAESDTWNGGVSKSSSCSSSLVFLGGVNVYAVNRDFSRKAAPAMQTISGRILKESDV